MRKTFLAGIFILFFLTLHWSSCKKDNLEELMKQDTTGTVVCDTSFVLSYTNDVVPILSKECYSCHNSLSAPFLAGGNVLDNYNSLKVFVENDKLLCVIKHTPGCLQMPRGGAKLSDCRIARIEAWVNQGYPEN